MAEENTSLVLDEIKNLTKIIDEKFQSESIKETELKEKQLLEEEEQKKEQELLDEQHKKDLKKEEEEQKLLEKEKEELKEFQEKVTSNLDSQSDVNSDIVKGLTDVNKNLESIIVGQEIRPEEQQMYELQSYAFTGVIFVILIVLPIWIIYKLYISWWSRLI